MMQSLGDPSFLLHRLRKRNVDHVLGDEPHLEFVAADDVAHNQIVGAVVPVIGGQPRHCSRLFEHDLVRGSRFGVTRSSTATNSGRVLSAVKTFTASRTP